MTRIIGIDPGVSHVSFSVPGLPVAKGRPRFARKGRFVTTYTPKKTEKYEEYVALCCKSAMRGKPPMEGAINLAVNVFVPIPVSWSKKKKAAALAGELHATSKPDTDNYVKAAQDGISGIAFHDDAQIVSLSATKRYADVPRVQVDVWVML